MTASDRSAGGLGLAEPTALPRLLAVPVGEFATDYWGRLALLSRREDLGHDFTDLLDESSIDELVSERGLRTPFLRVAKDGSTLGDRAFTASGGVGATINDQVSDDKLVQLFANGSTMVLQALHRVWPPIIAFCQQLAADLGHPVQANAYVTPPQSRGFDDHYDVHDVFVLQLAGEKRWSIHAPVHESPLRTQPWTDRRAAVERRAAEEPLIEAVLRPGDCLYLPRGFLHAATALGGVSAHLTLGLHTWTRYGVAEKLLAEALQHAARRPELRSSLPLGVELGNPDRWADDFEEIRAALLAAVRDLPAQTLAAGLQNELRGSQRAAPIGPLEQLRGSNRLGAGDVLTVRDHLAATLTERPDGSASLRSRAGELSLSATETDGVAELLRSGHASVSQVGVDLARRLVLAGVAVVS